MISRYYEFIELAKRLNFSSAALKLNTSQPTLSRHIAELEQELGFKLFERKPMALTAAGKLFLEAASEAIAILETARQHALEISQREARLLSVSMTPGATIMSNTLFEALATVRATVPDFELNVVGNKSMSVLEHVTSGSVLLGFVPASIPIPEGFTCERLFSYPLDVWGHHSGPLCDGRPHRFDELVGYRLIESTSSIFDEWLTVQKEVFLKKGLTPTIRAKKLETLNDFALSFQPDEIMIAEEMNQDPSSKINPNLVQLHMEDPDLEATACAVYRTDSDDAALRLFLPVLREAARKRDCRPAAGDEDEA